MGFRSHYVSSPGWCFSTENYKEWIITLHLNSDDDVEKNPLCFHLS